MKHFTFKPLLSFHMWDVCISFYYFIPYKIKTFKRLSYYFVPGNGHYFYNSEFYHYMTFDCSSYLFNNKINVNVEFDSVIIKDAQKSGYMQVN